MPLFIVSQEIQQIPGGVVIHTVCIEQEANKALEAGDIRLTSAGFHSCALKISAHIVDSQIEQTERSRSRQQIVVGEYCNVSRMLLDHLHSQVRSGHRAPEGG